MGGDERTEPNLIYFIWGSRVNRHSQKLQISSIHTPRHKGDLETNQMHFKWEVTRTHGNQPNGAACE